MNTTNTPSAAAPTTPAAAPLTEAQQPTTSPDAFADGLRALLLKAAQSAGQATATPPNAPSASKP